MYNEYNSLTSTHKNPRWVDMLLKLINQSFCRLGRLIWIIFFLFKKLIFVWRGQVGDFHKPTKFIRTNIEIIYPVNIDYNCLK